MSIKLRDLLKEASAEEVTEDLIIKLVKENLSDLEKLIKSKSKIDFKFNVSSSRGFLTFTSDDLIKQTGICIDLFSSIKICGMMNLDLNKDNKFLLNVYWDYVDIKGNKATVPLFPRIVFDSQKEDWKIV